MDFFSICFFLKDTPLAWELMLYSGMAHPLYSFGSGFDVLLKVLPQDLRMLGHQDREGRKYWELYLMIQRVLAASG